ncbi:MAG: asparagine synthase (glutamine-hydrolyzing) [Defluviitaleaceae bacterium]|nr:asparagine synthase (glutamine-hydrolyzing) [Defluviitaleaceae bacterium]
MSGIGGIVGYGVGTLAAAQVCDGMLTALKGRGADIHGTFISEEVCLIYAGNTRTDIGKQPIRASLGNKAYVLVFDGELYNKDELQKELVTMGYRFADASDAAIVLSGYMAWGESCVDRMNGIFAFALWDGTQLFIARDRLGLRPMYYSVGSYGLVFASTIRAILAHPRVKPVIGEEGAAEILLLGPGRSPSCGIFKGISELSPGEYGMYIPGQGMRIHTYWQLRAQPHSDNFKETVLNVRNLLKDAIARQSFGKEKMATLLSGGLDSSAVAALSGCKSSYSVDYIGNDKHFKPTAFQPESDNEYINRMVSSFGLRHKRVVLGNDELANTLTDAMIARGLPGMADVDSALLLFLKKVGETVPFALSGEGADEILGGYPWYQSIDENSEPAKTFPWSQAVDYRAKFLLPNLVKDPEEYVRSRFKKAISSAEILCDDEPIEKKIRQMYTLNIKWFLQTLACRNDSMAAAAGISVRAPFLDYRLVEYLYNVPWAFKNFSERKNEKREKGLLREALKGVLPEKILTRKKSPFPKTHNPAYLERVKGMLEEVMEDKNAPIFSLVSRDALSELLDESNLSSRPNWYGQLMSHPQTISYFLQINAWMKEFAVSVEI